MQWHYFVYLRVLSHASHEIELRPWGIPLRRGVYVGRSATRKEKVSATEPRSTVNIYCRSVVSVTFCPRAVQHHHHDNKVARRHQQL
jgi:hypothetical protein